jgi:hypothetical protein
MSMRPEFQIFMEKASESINYIFCSIINAKSESCFDSICNERKIGQVTTSARLHPSFNPSPYPAVSKYDAV